MAEKKSRFKTAKPAVKTVIMESPATRFSKKKASNVALQSKEVQQTLKDSATRQRYNKDTDFRNKVNRDEDFRSSLNKDRAGTMHAYDRSQRLTKLDMDAYTSTNMGRRIGARLYLKGERALFGAFGGLGEAARQGRRASTREESKEIRRDYVKRSVANALERTFGIAGEVWAQRIRQSISRIRSDDPEKAFIAVKNNFTNVASAIENIENVLEKHNKRIKQAFDRIDTRTSGVMKDVQRMIGYKKDAANDNFKDEINTIKTTVTVQARDVNRIQGTVSSLDEKYGHISNRVDLLEKELAEIRSRQTVIDSDDDDPSSGGIGGRKKNGTNDNGSWFAPLAGGAAAAGGAYALKRKLGSKVASTAAKKGAISRIVTSINRIGIKAAGPIAIKVFGSKMAGKVLSAIALGGPIGVAIGLIFVAWDFYTLDAKADEFEAMAAKIPESKSPLTGEDAGYVTGGTMEGFMPPSSTAINARTAKRPLTRPTTNQGRSLQQTIDDRIQRSGVENENKQFMQYGKMPGGFEFIPGHMGRLGSSAAVAASGAMPLGGSAYSSGSSGGYSSGVGSSSDFSGRMNLGMSSGGRQGGYGAPGEGTGSSAPIGGGSQLLGPLKEIRAQQWSQMNDPKVRAAVLARMDIEVGSQGPEAQQAWLESISNRAASRGKSLYDVVSGSDGYYPTSDNNKWVARMQGAGKLESKYGELIGKVGEGSNISNFATGNASGDVGFGQGKARKMADGSYQAPGQSAAFGGERFGGEAPDLAWIKRMRSGEYSSKLATTGQNKFFMSQEGYSSSELSTISKQSPGSTVMGDPNWGEKYNQMNSEAKKQGLKMHDYYEGRGGPTGDNWSKDEWERINKERTEYNKLNDKNYTMDEWRKNGNYLGATHDKILAGEKRGSSSYEIDNMEDSDINSHMAWRRQAGVKSKFMPKNFNEEHIAAFKKANPDWKDHVTGFAFNEHGTFKDKNTINKGWEGNVTSVFANSAKDTHNYGTPGGKMAGATFGQNTSNPIAPSVAGKTPYIPGAAITNKKDAREIIAAASRGEISLSSAAVDRALKTEGLHEVRDRETLKEYLKGGGKNIDPASTAWCGAFVNTALADVGMKGSNSLVATDYMKWGDLKKQADVTRGDVLVQHRGLSPGQTGGHVGMATGEVKRDSAGRVTHIEMLGGNQKDSAAVSRKWVGSNELMVRGPNDASYTKEALEALRNKTPAPPQPNVNVNVGGADQAGIVPGGPSSAPTPVDPTMAPDSAVTPVETTVAPPPTNEMETTNDATNAAAIDKINAAAPEIKYDTGSSGGQGGASSEPRGTGEGGSYGGGARHNPETRGSEPGSGGRGASGRCFV